MNGVDIDIQNLIVDYLTGQLEGEGAEQLTQWVQESDEHAAYFVRQKELWMGAGLGQRSMFDADAAFRRFKHQVMERPGTPKSTQWLEASRRHTHEIFQWAAAILIPLLATCTVILSLQVKNHYDGEVVVSTMFGQESTFQLPDGTKVHLEEDSRLCYNSSDFRSGRRRVDFQGEAYFIVQSDVMHPFDIETENEHVRVLGTEFNLRSRSGEKSDVLTLDKGCVEFTNLATNITERINMGDVLTLNLDNQRMYTHHRSVEEIRLAQARQRDEQKDSTMPVHVQDVSSDAHGYSMQVVIDKNVAPGVYRLNMTHDQKVSITRAREDSSKPFQSGDGTAKNPYIIASARQMCNMASVLKPRQMVYFALAADIDLKGIDWMPLNDDIAKYQYWISLDGRNHVIRHLTPSLNCLYSSFFGVMCGTCKNVGFEDVNINSTGLGSGVLGGYLGHSTYPGITKVENCYFTGHVSSRSYAGGIAGNIGGSTIIRGCSSSVDVTSVDSYAGGLVGKVRAPLLMQECYVEGSVAGKYAGGVVGGGQDAKTPFSRYDNVIVCSKSIFGSNGSTAIGGTVSGDTLQNAVYGNNTYVNGNKVEGGQNHSTLHKQTRSWRGLWYCKNV